MKNLTKKEVYKLADAVCRTFDYKGVVIAIVAYQEGNAIFSAMNPKGIAADKKNAETALYLEQQLDKSNSNFYSFVPSTVGEGEKKVTFKYYKLK